MNAVKSGLELAIAFVVLLKTEPREHEELIEVNIDKNSLIPWLHHACLAGESHESFPYSHYALAQVMFAHRSDLNGASTLFMMECFRIAATANYPPAMHNSALLFKDTDHSVAIRFYKIAAGFDYLPSLKAFRQIYMKQEQQPRAQTNQ